MKNIIALAIALAIAAWALCILYALDTKAEPFIWRDQNGCEYLVKQDWLTPRNHPNGTQICNK